MRFIFNLFKCLTLVFVTTLFLSCEDDEMQGPDIDQGIQSPLPDGDFFRPMVAVEKGNNAMSVSIIDPRPFTNYSVIPTDPEYYEVFFSTDADSLVLQGTYDYPETSVVFNDLADNTPIYITVSSNEEGFAPYFSDTVMVIPSSIIEPEELFPDYDFPLSAFASPRDLGYLAFESYDFINEDYSTDYLYAINTTSDELIVVEEGAHSISWANQSNAFAYVSTAVVGTFLNSIRITIFNAETAESTTLVDVENEGLNVVNPVFSPDDQLIAYLSNENSTEAYHFNIWTIDVESKETVQRTDFEAVNFSCQGHLDWSADPNTLYVTGYFYPSTARNSIYKVDLATGGLTPVLDSRWENKQSSVSPDNSKIAFWSKRSGEWELWIYDLVTEEYSQVTGGNNSYSFSPSQITWLSQYDIALTAYSNGRNRVVKVRI